jgi:agmatine deiminase
MQPVRACGITPSAGGWYVPADHLPHERSWMAWPARRDVWGSLLPRARDDIARIARAIAKHEPVHLIARPEQAADAAAACGRTVEIVPLINDDLWMRDIGPVFLVNDCGGLAGLDLNFNGWGHKQVHTNDANVADEVLSLLGVRSFKAPFTSEGGALEFDGDGTALATVSSIINPNRNPGRSKAQLTQAICDYTGASKVVWVPGLRGHDITDDHIDSLAVFAKPGVLAVDQPADPGATDPWATSGKQALRILSSSRDAHGRRFACHISRESGTIPGGQNPDQFVNVYVNWYVANGAVFLPSFADHRSDAAAHALASKLYPDREIVSLRIDNLAAGGGGIHCATQQQPKIFARHLPETHPESDAA